jgi:SAM-dependent methyltransferase
MRETKIERMNTYKTSVSSMYYLVMKYLIEDLQLSIDKYAKGKLIDIGCGNKPYEALMKNVTEYTGCDIVQSSEERVDVLCEANNIPLPSDSFDTAFSTQTIEHVADHKGLVKEAFRLLKKDGYFIVSGPMSWTLHEEPYDFFRFTKHGFRYLLEEAGFEVVEILSNGGMWSTAGQHFLLAITNKNPKSHWLIKFWRKLFKFFRMHQLVNRICRWMDKKEHNTVNTLNYVVVAKKP